MSNFLKLFIFLLSSCSSSRTYKVEKIYFESSPKSHERVLKNIYQTGEYCSSGDIENLPPLNLAFKDYADKVELEAIGIEEAEIKVEKSVNLISGAITCYEISGYPILK